VVTLSGRGDKDVELVLEYVKMKEKTRKKYDSNSKK
jgi:tryptophan synthase beta subunit